MPPKPNLNQLPTLDTGPLPLAGIRWGAVQGHSVQGVAERLCCKSLLLVIGTSH